MKSIDRLKKAERELKKNYIEPRLDKDENKAELEKIALDIADIVKKEGIQGNADSR